MKDLSGQTIGNYRIVTSLGAGGMGRVYRAQHLHLERVVAIKVLHDHFATDPAFRARFRQEAKTRVTLHHPNITEVIDFGEDAGAFYLVMELVSAGSVRTLLERYAQAGQVLPLALSLDLVRQAAGALAYAHARGVVHRDIKPDNLLLTQGSTADSYVVKISDFDLARLAQAEGMTPTGETRGTPAYMSPEQCQGIDLDGRSDLYSLGIVLYELTTGSPPFQTKNISDAVHKHIYTRPPSPRSVRPHLPQELVDLIVRCLEKNPQQRFASADDFMTALQRIRVDSPQPPPSPLPPVHDVSPPSTVPSTPEQSSREDIVPPPASDPEPQSPRSTKRISVQLERDTVILTPGQSTTVRVTLANWGDTVDHFTVAINGIPEHWVQGPTQTVQLNPTGKTEVACVVQPPRSPDSRAGEHRVEVRAHSRENPSEYGAASARWTVLPFTGSTLGLAPTRAGGRRGAEYTVTLRNEGNTGARYKLGGKDEEHALTFHFNQEDVLLDPGQETDVKLTLQAPLRWVGNALMRAFQVSATASTEARTARDGMPAPQMAAGQFVHRALISSWIPPVLLALLIGGPLLYRLLWPPESQVPPPPVGPTQPKPDIRPGNFIVNPGEIVVLSGKALGTTKGEIYVNSEPIPPTVWRPEQIKFRVPQTADVGVALPIVILMPDGTTKLEGGTLTIKPSKPPVINRDIYIQAKHSGKNLAIGASSRADGAPAIQFAPMDIDDQKWKLVPAGNDYYYIQAKHSGKNLAIGASSRADGAPAIQFAPMDIDDQKWKLVPAGNDYYYIQAKHSGKNLAIGTSSRADGAPAIQFAPMDIDDQKWKLVEPR